MLKFPSIWHIVVKAQTPRTAGTDRTDQTRDTLKIWSERNQYWIIQKKKIKFIQEISGWLIYFYPLV